MKPHFELQRVRDFGEIITDSFTFFKDNFIPLLKPLLLICGFFLVLTVIGHVIMQKNILGMATVTRDGGDPVNSVIEVYKGLGYYYLGAIPFFLSIFIVTYSYISINLEKKDGEKPSIDEVWGYFKYFFFRTLGSCIVIVIVIIIGSFLCLLPGIYLSVVLSLALPIIIFENTSFGYGFSKSFKLISGNWWFTFGLLIVMGMIVGTSAYLVSFPISLLTIFSTFGVLGNFATPLTILGSVLLHLIALVGYSLIAVSIALCYFSYSEQKEGTGLMGRINQLGKNDDDTTNLPTEQY